MYLTDQDIQLYSNYSLDSLNDIMESCREVHGEKGYNGVIEMLKNGRGILNKRCLNFVSALMLHGGGQRPQVYTILEAPDKVDFVQLRDIVKNTGVFTVRVSI